MCDLKHIPVARRGGSCPVGKPQHGEDPGEESIPVCTSQISHPGRVGATAPPFPWVHMRVLLPFPPPSAFQLFSTVLQGQWEGGRRGQGLFLPSTPCSSQVRMCPSAPATSLSQNCPC